jgi:PTH1 family peptidyl-tRNA hydrolase
LKIDHCIVGLGNPGSKYFSTRHNIGFIIIDVLAGFFKIESFTLENNYLYAETLYKDKQVVLMKPLTYMNASGRAVKEFYGKYEASHENTLIIYDDQEATEDRTGSNRLFMSLKQRISRASELE